MRYEPNKNITNAGNHPIKFASVAKLNCVRLKCAVKNDFECESYGFAGGKNVNEKLSSALCLIRTARRIHSRFRFDSLIFAVRFESFSISLQLIHASLVDGMRMCVGARFME